MKDLINLLGYSDFILKENIENWTIGYNHKAKKNSPNKFSTIKLEQVELDLLPDYIQDNSEKYKSWITK